MVEVKHLYKTFSGENGETEVLKDVSLTVKDGEIFGVIGESGCGKSTMGRTLVNLEAPTAGDVRINGESARAILQKDPKAFHQMVQMVFQNPFDTFLPTETIEQIMLRPLEINGLGGSEEERRRRIVQLLEDGGLSPAEDFLGRYPHELSGGQLQRISILRAMSVNPLFLVVDEPVSMLDVSAQAVCRELQKVAVETLTPIEAMNLLFRLKQML